MKQLLTAIVALSLLTAIVVIPTGCATQTSEGVRYNTLRTTWDVAHTAYGKFTELAVSGKVKPFKEAAVDLAWNSFRASFKQALLAAQSDYSKPTPENVEVEKAKLISKIGPL